jgi:hypothetical protein
MSRGAGVISDRVAVYAMDELGMTGELAEEVDMLESG